MSAIAAKILISMLEKLITEQFMSKMLVYALGAWAKHSANTWDDKVVDAIASALEVPRDNLLVK